MELHHTFYTCAQDCCKWSPNAAPDWYLTTLGHHKYGESACLNAPDYMCCMKGDYITYTIYAQLFSIMYVCSSQWPKNFKSLNFKEIAEADSLTMIVQDLLVLLMRLL